jgi:DNA polymerase V
MDFAAGRLIMLALVDANNFFVSCERLYRPELRDRPVVVLSSNDGCIISRSNEAKAMGIKMGEPYFQIQAFLRQKGVVVCSGNLVAYKEISDKVMAVLARCTDALDTYSIDEAFLNIPKNAAGGPARYAANVRHAVDRVVGIPVSVGTAPTKTLAKLASERAKKTEAGVLEITDENRHEILAGTPLRDVWGIGPKAAEKLSRRGLFTASDFLRVNPVQVRKLLSIRGVMTQLELTGQPCLPLVTSPAPPKSIQVSRTWGTVLESIQDVTNAIIDNVVKAGRLLRKDKLAASTIAVYLRYGYRHHGECGYMTEDAHFPEPISSDIELVNAARLLLGKIYRPEYGYTQGGVILCRFTDSTFRQRSLFDQNERRSKYEALSRAIDDINEHFGERAVYPATLAIKDKKWRPRRKFLSPGMMEIGKAL